MSVLLKCYREEGIYAGIYREFYFAIILLVVTASMSVCGGFIRSETHSLAARLSCPTFLMKCIYMK